MYQQLGQLKIIDRLPRDLDELECIVNRAMDCRSAFMVYMAMHLTHEATPVGTIGFRAISYPVDVSRKNHEDIVFWGSKDYRFGKISGHSD